ncbi:MAG: phoR [Gemmatimonadetes bacterium]|nr:phoR [Gemmatimonadota bacterium]
MTLARRLLAGTAVLVVVLVAAIVLIAGGRLRQHLQDELSNRLEHEGRLLATEWLPGVDAAALAARAGGALGHRVTIIDSTGVVIGDSEFDEAGRQRLENHSTRPEVIEARRDGLGTSRRHSVSAGDDEVYVAIRHRLGFVRVSLATRSLDEIVTRAQRDVLMSGLIALVGALGLTVLFARSISQPVVELRDVARAIAAGDLQRRPSLSAPGEVGDLATALSRMAEQLGLRLEALRADEQLMTAVLESLDEGLLALDADGRVVRINERGRSLLRANDATPFALSSLPSVLALQLVIDDGLRGVAAEAREITVHGRTLAVASRPLSTGGAVVTLLELTALRRLETVRRDFVANVSHELKTPLTAVSGFAETLLDENISPANRRSFVETIRSNATRMQRIVDDLLDLSRIESGGWHPQLATMDVAALVYEIVANCQQAASDKGLALQAEVSDDVQELRADPTAARQVLQNLVENAVRYTSAGSVTLRAQRWGQGSGVRFTVQDTGVGIPPEHLPRIFERFYRVDAGRSRDVGGTGLGLAIVKHLVESHNGDVEASSQPGRGTAIVVVFPGTTV